MSGACLPQETGPSAQGVFPIAANSKKKERSRRKRLEKQRALKRAESGSVYRRIGELGQTKACYINKNWREAGFASIHCLRTVPGGGHAMAAFLVDIWCVGLKDAWGKLDITTEQFERGVVRHMEEHADVELVRVDVDLVRRLIAGAIRFSGRNGFRLPPRYERWTAFLGGVGPIDSADLTPFGVDGGLRYVGTVDDLDKRLVGVSVEEFLARDDLHYVLGSGESTLLDDDDMALTEMLEGIKERGLAAVRQWCFANGSRPHPLLPQAWDITFEAIGQVGSSDDEAEQADLTSASDRVAGEAVVNCERLLGFENASDRLELETAMAQLQGYCSQFDSFEDFTAAMGFNAFDDADEPE